MRIVHICLGAFYLDHFAYQENMLPKFHKMLGYHVEVIASMQSFDQQGKLFYLKSVGAYWNEYGIRVTRLPYKSRNSIWKKLKRYSGTYTALEYAAPDTLFIHNCQFLDIDQIVKYLQRHPDVTVYVDNHADFSNSATNWLSKNILHKVIWRRCAHQIEPYTKKFYGVLPARVDFLREVYRLPEEKCELLVMGADDDLVEQARRSGARERIRARYGINDEDILIMTGGKINRYRSETLHLMQAVIAIQRKNLKLLIFGSVSEQLRGEFDRLCKDAHIVYAGWLQAADTYDYFPAADLVVFPGLHSVMWEQAVAQGKACIFRNLDGFHHVDVGGNAVFVDDTSAKGLENAVLEIVDHPSKYQHMVSIAEEKGMNAFSYKEIARRSILQLPSKKNEVINMCISDSLMDQKSALAVVGLGYVGLPLAVAFSKKLKVIGFDIDPVKIERYRSGIDSTHEVGDEAVKASPMEFTNDEGRLRDAAFLIICVPTPIHADHTPDLSPVEEVSRTVGRNLQQGAIVVYESTVYPGVTEDICVPILEKTSGMKCGTDFKVGYSPERINPGDKLHRLENIRKIVSGIDQTTCHSIRQVYDLVIEAGTYPVSNIKTAEAIKVVENSQRDINIAFMNELAMVFDRMGIDTNEVVDGMNTKWNALGFRPGLVGGHCIGIDPYYFTYKAERLGYHSQIILNGRIVNDSIGSYIADTAIKQMVEAGHAPKDAKVVILGLTFKENCSDIRNSRVYDIVRRLNEYGISSVIVDPWADAEKAMKEYGISLHRMEDTQNADCIIVAVAHDDFKRISLEDMKKVYRAGDDRKKVLLDVKGIYSIRDLEMSGLRYWRL